MSGGAHSRVRNRVGLRALMEEPAASGWFFAPELAWQKDAACGKTPDPDLFFPNGRQSNKSKKLCAGCQVRIQCRDHALMNEEEGIWGGLTQPERERLLASKLPLHTQEIA